MKKNFVFIFFAALILTACGGEKVQTETVKVENAQTEIVKTEAPKTERPKTERPKTESPKSEVKNDASREDQAAYQSAKNYDTYAGFSDEGLRSQLEFEGFPKEAIEYAIQKLNQENSSRENEAALKSAKSYLDYTSFSEEGLREQLAYEGYPDDSIDYAITNLGGDPAQREAESALGSAKQYLDYSAFSSEGLRRQLEYEGYPQEAIDYAMENIVVDWNEQAEKMAKQYADSGMSMSNQGIYDQLIYEGFSEEEAQYGVSQLE